MADKVYVLLAADSSPWTVPADFSSTNTVVCIGGGGGGRQSSTNANKTGGGGGAYSYKTNVAWTPASSISFGVGAAGANGSSPTDGGDTWIGGSGYSTSDCGAKGGQAGQAGAGGTGGASASGRGTGSNSGGTGGGGSSGGGGGGGGAGASGSAGKNGGAAGSGGGGGGGGCGGASSTNGGAGSSSAGGNGGDGPAGTGHGVANGGSATAGSGGGGAGGRQTSAAGGAGAQYDQYTATDGAHSGSTYGPGGGGGGGGTGLTGGAAGGYGGGGCGSATGSTATNGTAGLIVIIYTPSEDGSLASASGAASLSGTGAAIFKASGSTSGTGTPAAVGAAQFKGVGATTGTGAASASGASRTAGVGASSGIAAGTVVGKSLAAAAGSPIPKVITDQIASYKITSDVSARFQNLYRYLPSGNAQMYFMLAAFAGAPQNFTQADLLNALVQAIDKCVVAPRANSTYYSQFAHVVFPSGKIYFCNIAGGATAASAPSDSGVTNPGDFLGDGSITWEYTGTTVPSSWQWFLTDINGDMLHIVHPDSTDAYAGMLLAACAVALPDSSWLSTASAFGTMTRMDVMNVVMQNCCTDELSGSPGGPRLTGTFQSDTSGAGSPYDIEFLADNVEVWRGYMGQTALCRVTGDSSGAAAAVAFASDLKKGILALKQSGRFKTYSSQTGHTSLTGDAAFVSDFRFHLWPTFHGMLNYEEITAYGSDILTYIVANTPGLKTESLDTFPLSEAYYAAAMLGDTDMPGVLQNRVLTRIPTYTPINDLSFAAASYNMGRASGFSLTAATGAAEGTSTVTASATSISTAASVGASSGAGTASGVISSAAQAIASSAGISSADGLSFPGSNATASGAATVSGSGNANGIGTATVSGQGAATASGSSRAASVADSSGSVIVSAGSASLYSGAASATGNGGASGVGAASSMASGSATGAGVASGITAAITRAIASGADGQGAANGISGGILTASGQASGTATVNAAGNYSSHTDLTDYNFTPKGRRDIFTAPIKDGFVVRGSKIFKVTRN